MKIKILRSCSGLNFSVVQGTERDDLDDAIAKDLIKAGHAQEIKQRKKAAEKSGE